MGTSTFCEYTVVHEQSVAKIDMNAPLDKASGPHCRTDSASQLHSTAVHCVPVLVLIAHSQAGRSPTGHRVRHFCHATHYRG